MYNRFILAIVAIIIMAGSADAQRPKRKGTTPFMKKSKNDQKQADFTLDQLTGKWQEASRIVASDSTQADIKDTIYLNFTGKNKVDTREGDKPNVKGEAMIDIDNTLTVAADVYTIWSITADEMVLDDNDKYIHTFRKTNSFWFENVGKDSMRSEKYLSPVEFVPDKLIGNWMVYKRDAKPGTVSSAAPIIRYLKITDKVNDTTANGKITCYKEEEAVELPCKIIIYKTSIQVATEKYFWYLPVYKADGKELIFGDTKLMLYYCKPLE